MATQTPVILVAGALGCGKTSYVRALVQANPGVRFGVVVNEFGEIGVDGDLLSPYVPDVVEIRNGCICCVTQDQLVPAIREVITKYSVDVLLVEMSGAADSMPVARQIALLAPLVSLRAHVVMGDCTVTPEEATTDRAYCTALSRAGVVALSKSDIADPAVVAAWRSFVSQFNPTALMVDIRKGEGDLATLMESRAAHGDAGGESGPHPGYASLYRTVGDMSERQVRSLSELLGAEVVRMKGIVQVDGAWCEVQRVRKRLTIEPYRGMPPARGRLVFISRELSRLPLQSLVSAAFAAAREDVVAAEREAAQA